MFSPSPCARKAFAAGAAATGTLAGKVARCVSEGNTRPAEASGKTTRAVPPGVNAAARANGRGVVVLAARSGQGGNAYPLWRIRSASHGGPRSTGTGTICHPGQCRVPDETGTGC